MKTDEEKEPIKMPICPYCKIEMNPARYVGYYESFDYWSCNCDKLPDSKKSEYIGSYA